MVDKNDSTVLTEIVLAGGALGFNWLPVFVAQREGLFTRAGLSVELRRMGAVDKATTAVREGEAQFAITPPEGAVANFVAGGGLRVVAGNVNKLPMSLVAHPSIRAIEQLKGKKLGTSSMTEGTAIYTREMLAQHGVQYPEDYEFSAVGVHPARWKALQEGTIDAAVQLIPLNFVAFDQGWSNLGEVSDYIPEIVFSALIADQNWLAGHAPAAVALLQALLAATDFVYDPANDADLIPIVMEITQSDEQYARRSLDYMREINLFARQLEVPPAAFEKTLELMEKADLLAAGDFGTARGLIDTAYLTEASAASNAPA